jgi:hypothetical protein
MADKLTPKQEKPLIPIYQFLSGARVTDADVQMANERWKDERDDDEFTNIMEAKAE